MPAKYIINEQPTANSFIMIKIAYFVCYNPNKMTTRIYSIYIMLNFGPNLYLLDNDAKCCRVSSEFDERPSPC